MIIIIIIIITIIIKWYKSRLCNKKDDVNILIKNRNVQNELKRYGSSKNTFLYYQYWNIGDVAEWKINSVLEYFIDICVFCDFI